MKRKTILTGLLALSAFGMMAGCGADPEYRQQMNLEQRAEMLDEREDEQLNAPGVELRQERMEDRLEERADNM
ncbi:hypothetical protein MO973_10605 [Paenibacillus sp. TRM 82003]|nr:hypothetical protein [Paenibacillus sp. TRM 82003]